MSRRPWAVGRVVRVPAVAAARAGAWRDDAAEVRSYALAAVRAGCGTAEAVAAFVGVACPHLAPELVAAEVPGALRALDRSGKVALRGGAWVAL